MKMLLTVSFLIAMSLTNANAQGLSKTTSTATISSFVIAPYPMLTTIGTVALPSKYNSLKNVLLVSVSVLESCSGDTIYSRADAGGVALAPSAIAPTTLETDCSDEGYHFTTIQYTLNPVTLAGVPLADDATVVVKVASASGTALINSGLITVVSAK